MKLTLRKADRVARQLKKLVEAESVTSSFRLSIYGTYTTDEISDKHAAVVARHADVANRVASMKLAIYDLRLKLGDANVAAGVHALLAERAYLESLNKAIPGFRTESDEEVPAFDAREVLEHLGAAKSRLATVTRYGIGNEDSITVEVPSRVLKPQTRRIVAINDKLEHLNASNTIETSEETASLLATLELI